MLKQGIIQLPTGFFPKLQEHWNDDEKAHMLLITGFDVGDGLSLVQSVPELYKEDKCIAYAKRFQAAVDLAYPIVDTSMNKEYVQAKVIAMLNAASADDEKPSYKVTFAFICDAKYLNFKLAGIFTGDTDQGSWAAPDVVKGIAAALNMPVYKPSTDVKTEATA